MPDKKIEIDSSKIDWSGTKITGRINISLPQNQSFQPFLMRYRGESYECFPYEMNNSIPIPPNYTIYTLPGRGLSFIPIELLKAYLDDT
jgi:hypothetical protein